MFLLFHLFLYFWYASATLHLAVLWIHIFLTYQFFFFFLTRNGFEDFENIMDIWLLKYFMKLLGSKLYILNTFNLWAFDVSLPLSYDIGDYLVFVMTSLWRVIILSLWRCLCNVWLPYLCDDKLGWRLLFCMTRVNLWVCGWGRCP